MLKGTANPADYPQINTRWEGVERLWTCAFLNFDHMTHVQVSGRGHHRRLRRCLDAARWRRGARRRPATRSIPGPCRGRCPAAAATPRRTAAGGGPAEAANDLLHAIASDVHITGLHLQQQAVWCLHILYSQDVVVDNLNIRAIGRIPSSDGIDVDSSDGVQISHCDIACDDDDIAIKSGKDADGLRVNRPSENVTISDCTIGSGGGITMGSEVSGGIRHVLVQRCNFTGTGQPARFKSQPSRGGMIEDIIYRDIQMNHTREAVEFDMSWRMVGPALPPAKVLTIVRNIQFYNFTGTCQSGGNIRGLKGSPIDNVKFVNCKISAQRGLTIGTATNIDTSGLDLTVAQGQPIINLDAAPAASPAQPTAQR